MKAEELEKKVDEWVEKKAEETGLSEELVKFTLAPKIIAVKDFIDWVIKEVKEEDET